MMLWSIMSTNATIPRLIVLRRSISSSVLTSVSASAPTCCSFGKNYHHHHHLLAFPKSQQVHYSSLFVKKDLPPSTTTTTDTTTKRCLFSSSPGGGEGPSSSTPSSSAPTSSLSQREQHPEAKLDERRAIVLAQVKAQVLEQRKAQQLQKEQEEQEQEQQENEQQQQQPFLSVCAANQHPNFRLEQARLKLQQQGKEEEEVVLTVEEMNRIQTMSKTSTFVKVNDGISSGAIVAQRLELKRQEALERTLTNAALDSKQQKQKQKNLTKPNKK